jgi:tetratricopeptide (TPR) repeat protein
MKALGRSNPSCLILLLPFLLVVSCSKGYNTHADDYYEQGMLFYERMEYDRAVDSFSKVLELAPYGEENDRVYFMRGKAQLKARRYDPALYDFTKALDLAGEGDDTLRFLIYEMRGDAFLGKNEPQKAVQDFSVALGLKPEHENVKYIHVNRGWAFLRLRNFDAAITDFTKAVSIDADFAAAYYARGRAWLDKGDPPRALEDAKEAARLRPDVTAYDDFIYEIRSAMRKG